MTVTAVVGTHNLEFLAVFSYLNILAAEMKYSSSVSFACTVCVSVSHQSDDVTRPMGVVPFCDTFCFADGVTICGVHT